MLYLNQSYNYLVRNKKGFNYQIEPNANYCQDNLSSDFFKQHKSSKSSEYYIPVKDLIKSYGKSWLKLDIPKIWVNGKTRAISSRYVPIIEQFILQNKLSQYSIVANIKAVYDGEVIENDREAIKPYELDIYLPELKLAIEYNSIKFHSVKNTGNTYYHIKKSIRCRREGIRLIHIYGFENYETQMRLLQDLILGVDNYPKNDFNKNNLTNDIPKPTIIYQDSRFVIYGAGKLIS